MPMRPPQSIQAYELKKEFNVQAARFVFESLHSAFEIEFDAQTFDSFATGEYHL